MSTRCALFGMFLAALAIGIAACSGVAAERPLKQLSEAEIAQLVEVLPAKATVKPRQPRKLLIFWRCEGFFHEDAIAWSNKAFELIGEKTGAYTAVISADMAMFAPEKLREFDAVFFNNTSALKFENERIARRCWISSAAGRGSSARTRRPTTSTSGLRGPR
jgi:hypothetical protein